QRDVFFRVLGLQKQHLGDHDVRHVVIDGTEYENQPLFQQAGVDIVGALAPCRLLDHHRNEIQCVLFHIQATCSCPKPVISLKLIGLSVIFAFASSQSTTWSSSAADSICRMAS